MKQTPMKETITDYETTEVQKERIHCDFPSCMMTDEEGEMGTLKLYDNGERHYCSQHFREVVGVEEDVVRIDETDGEVTVVTEVNPVITMPWDFLSKPSKKPNEGYYSGVAIIVFPLAILFGLDAIDNYSRGIRDTVLGALLWIGLPLFLWFTLL